MAESREVHGTLQKVEGHLQLIPNGELHPDLAGVTIYSANKVGADKKHKVYAEQTDTFLVEIGIDGAYHVKGIAAAATSSPQQSAPPPPAPSTPVVSAAPPPAVAPAPHTTFIHPYNFVRLPSQNAMEEALDVPPFQRGQSALHDRYDKSLRTGYIACELTTCTDWFIPDPRKVHKPTQDGHATLGYFTLDEVKPNDWRENRPPDNDTTIPAIPGASLRGMIGSIFEIATLSCLRVFDPQSLDFRIGYGPDQDGENVGESGRGVAEYLPARIVKVSREGTARVEFLDGRFEADHRAMIGPAFIECYADRVKSGTGPTSDLAAILDAPDGSALAVRLKRSAKTHHTGFEYRIVQEPLFLFRKDDRPKETAAIGQLAAKLTSWAAADPETKDEFIVFGFLHRTGPNFPSKHRERFFFRARSTYNDPAGDHYLQNMDRRLAAFLADERVDAVADARVIDETVESLRGYADRHGKQISRAISHPPRVPQRNRRSPPPFEKKPLPSDFVQQSPDKVTIQPGDLFYALCETDSTGRRRIKNLYPIAIPRITYENSRGELLPDGFYPCSRRHECCPDCQAKLREAPFGERDLCDQCRDAWEHLCPACRVFGWTRDLKNARGLKDCADRIDSWAGHVRFTHGVLPQSRGQTPGQEATRVTLPILNSPKPTTTGFYLDPKDDWEDARETRWPPVLKYVSERDVPVPGYHTPGYRRDEAQLGGVKQYRRREKASRERAVPTRMNQTVDMLPAEMTFEFRVYFDNLSAEELGTLLFALTLNAPSDWKKLPQKPFHALGHGKPLGMGRCSIDVTSLCVEGPERYRADRFSGVTGSSAARKLADEDTKPFFEAWEKLKDNRELVRVREQLMEMLTVLPASEPIHYPRSTDSTGKVDFTWWKNAKQTGVMLPDPVEERQQPDKRLTD